MILLLTHPLHDARFNASIMNLQFFLPPCMHGEDRISGSVFDDNDIDRFNSFNSFDCRGCVSSPVDNMFLLQQIVRLVTINYNR